MYQFIARRMLATIPVLVIVAVLVFMLLRITPGDPAAIRRDPAVQKAYLGYSDEDGADEGHTVTDLPAVTDDTLVIPAVREGAEA